MCNRLSSLALISGAMAGLVAFVYLLFPPAQQVSAATPGTVTYRYDSMGRVIADTNKAGNSGAYAYDSSGNRTVARFD